MGGNGGDNGVAEGEGSKFGERELGGIVDSGHFLMGEGCEVGRREISESAESDESCRLGSYAGGNQ